ncbi:MAG: hypothetical protein ACOVMG_02795 [Flavobacterium sp.]
MSEAVIVSSILGGCGLLITLFYNYKNSQLAHHKMQKELFAEFNERYDKLNDSLSLLNESDTITSIKEKMSLIDNKSMYNVLIDYFNLCAEQYYWKQEKRISDKIWESWYNGMFFYYSNFSVVRDLWRDEIKEDGYKSYYLKKGDKLFK